MANSSRGDDPIIPDERASNVDPESHRGALRSSTTKLLVKPASSLRGISSSIAQWLSHLATADDTATESTEQSRIRANSREFNELKANARCILQNQAVGIEEHTISGGRRY